VNWSGYKNVPLFSSSAQRQSEYYSLPIVPSTNISLKPRSQNEYNSIPMISSTNIYSSPNHNWVTLLFLMFRYSILTWKPENKGLVPRPAFIFLSLSCFTLKGKKKRICEMIIKAFWVLHIYYVIYYNDAFIIYVYMFAYVLFMPKFKSTSICLHYQQ
jgi:hypothetical protein